MDSFPHLFTQVLDVPVNSMLCLLVAGLQGVLLNLILFTKVWGKQQTICKIGKRTGVTATIGAVLSFFGVGCTACQTALIIPVITLFTAGLSGFAVGLIMDTILLIAIVLSLFSTLNLLKIVTDSNTQPLKGETNE